MTNEEVRIAWQKKKNRRDRNIAIAIIVIVVTLIYLISNSKNPSGKITETNPNNHQNAFYVSQEFVKNNLKSPSTAVFPSWYDVKARVNRIAGTKNQYSIKAYVDSQNSFGALIRTNYICKVEYNKKKDTWKLLYINFIE